MQLAIHRVPVPDELSAWQDIFELKADTDLQARARKLRIWATELAQRQIALEMADEYLADLLSDYEGCLRAHKLKYTSAALKSVIVGGAGFAEDLIKLRFGKVASSFFAVSEMRADILLAEMLAPGRAVSLVTALNKRLSSG